MAKLTITPVDHLPGDLKFWWKLEEEGHPYLPIQTGAVSEKVARQQAEAAAAAHGVSIED